MESESSLPHSQVPAACPYPEPDQSSPYLPIPPLEESRVPFTLFASCQEISPSPEPSEVFRNIVRVLRWGVVCTSPSPQPEYYSSVVHDCSFNVFAATRQEVGTKCLLGEHQASISSSRLQFVTKLNLQLLMLSNCLFELHIAPLAKNSKFCELCLKKG